MQRIICAAHFSNCCKQQKGFQTVVSLVGLIPRVYVAVEDLVTHSRIKQINSDQAFAPLFLERETLFYQHAFAVL